MIAVVFGRLEAAPITHPYMSLPRKTEPSAGELCNPNQILALEYSQPARYCWRLMNRAASGTPVTSSFAEFHSIGLPTRIASPPMRHSSVSGTE